MCVCWLVCVARLPKKLNEHTVRGVAQRRDGVEAALAHVEDVREPRLSQARALARVAARRRRGRVVEVVARLALGGEVERVA